MGRLRLDPERNVVLQEMVLPMSALKVLTAVSHGAAMHAELPVLVGERERDRCDMCCHFVRPAGTS